MNSAVHASHVALPQVGLSGQQAVADSHVVLVGLGGIGSPAALYLAAAGVGRLTLIDFDRVADSNLSRQVLYTPADVGRHKTAVTAERLLEIAPGIQLHTFNERIGSPRLQAVGGEATLWIDGSDNFATRLACNEAALACAKPWIMASAIRFEGQMMTFTTAPDQPCYRCVYGDAAETLADCAGAGVFSICAGIMGLAAAGQALRLICRLPVTSGLQLFDAATMAWHQLAALRNADCPACGR